jgi:hypothetical protein
MQKLKMIPCPKCGEPFPELRLTKFGYNFCVNCSDVDAVVGITTIEGSGDHTYNDIIIMDRKKAMRIAKAEAEAMGRRAPDPIEILDMDRDEAEVSQSMKENTKKVLDDDNLTHSIPQREDHDEEDSMRIKGIDY